MTAPQAIRDYEVRARSTDFFGRVLCSARNHHFVIDGPVQNGCPGEEVTPPEAYLAGVAACAVELLHVIAKADGVPLGGVAATLNATVDRGNQPRTDFTVFNTVRLRLALSGTDGARAASLVEGFKRR